MKKIILLSMAIFISFAAGCEKNQAVSTNDVENVAHTEANTLADKFQQADDKITVLTDQIENTELSVEKRQEVLCQEFPKVYQTQYIPALLALNAEDTSQKQLINEMQFTLNYYQQQLNIKCP